MRVRIHTMAHECSWSRTRLVLCLRVRMKVCVVRVLRREEPNTVLPRAERTQPLLGSCAVNAHTPTHTHSHTHTRTHTPSAHFRMPVFPPPVMSPSHGHCFASSLTSTVQPICEQSFVTCIEVVGSGVKSRISPFIFRLRTQPSSPARGKCGGGSERLTEVTERLEEKLYK